MKRFLLVLCLVVLLVLTHQHWKPSPKPTHASAALQLHADDLQELLPSTLTESVHASGHLQPWRQAVLSVPVSGSVERMVVRPGTPVQEGALLLLLESLPFDAALAEAIAQLKEAQAEQQLSVFLAEQQSALKQRDFTSQSDHHNAHTRLEHAKAQLEHAQAQVALAQDRYEHARVHAPFSGFVTAQHTQEGEAIAAGTPLLTLSDTHLLELPLRVPVAQSLSLQPGQTCDLNVAGVPHNVEGTIDRINPVTDDNTHAVTVFVTLANDDHHLKGGLFAHTHLITHTHEGVLLVQRTAIQHDAQEQAYIVTVQDKHLKRHNVVVHERSGQDSPQVWIETSAPLGSLVVTTHLPHARPGQSIQLSED